ncbi:MAG TPA: hypothetical protein VE758_00875 [Chthoniobacterales bacterium]|nr:hypothetical protein [Chthoniobacterales bacterium]
MAVALGGATVFCAAVRLTERLPVSPWEAAIATEALRLNVGLPIYESGRATHMYGPLVSVVLAGIYRCCGLSFIASRVAMAMIAFCLAILLGITTCREKSREWLPLAILLYLGVNFRTNLSFFTSQADCIAALLSLVALYFWITRRNSVVRVATSVAFFVTATLFKQTAAACGLIPIAHVFLWQRPLRLRGLAASLVPVIFILITFAAIRLVWPNMFAAIIVVPAAIKVYYAKVLPVGGYLIATFPLFLVGAIAAFLTRHQIGERERWIWAAIVVLVPTSIWATCKSGGSYNSLLLAYLAMTALFVIKQRVIYDWITSLSPVRRVLTAGALGLAILFSFFAQFDRTLTLLSARWGDDKYEQAVAIARNLGDGIVSPQDPTIAYRATGYFGHSIFLELDTHAVNGNWPNELPGALLEELDGAKYVMVVHGYIRMRFFEQSLAARGFWPLEVPALANSAYVLWKKSNL